MPHMVMCMIKSIYIRESMYCCINDVFSELCHKFATNMIISCEYMILLLDLKMIADL